MTTVGADGAVVSSTALSVAGAETLPAASVTVAVTTSSAPSGGRGTVVSTEPAAIWSAVRMMSWLLTPSVTVSVSPATAVAGRPTVTATVVLLPSSPLLRNASLLASLVMTMVGASVGVASSAASSVACAGLPAASVTLAFTVSGPSLRLLRSTLVL